MHIIFLPIFFTFTLAPLYVIFEECRGVDCSYFHLYIYAMSEKSLSLKGLKERL